MSGPLRSLPASGGSHLASAVAFVLLLCPGVLVAACATPASGIARSIGAGVAVTLGLEAVFLIFRIGSLRAAASWLLPAFYLVAFAVVRFNAPYLDSPVTQGALAIALLVPIATFVRRELIETGGNVRQAKLLIRQLLARTQWPESFEDYRGLPEIRALRTAIRDNPAPILPLLAHADVRIQIATLTALEGQPIWRKGQAETVVQRANYSDEPAVRSVAMAALANVHKARHIICLLPFLRDSSSDVRRAAAVAILWDARTRWPEVRSAIRTALSDPQAARDGPLPCSGQYPQAALDDLAAWSAESGAIGKRSTQTLVRHCKKSIHDDGSPEALARVTEMMTNPKVPPGLRVEIAHKLQEADQFPTELAARLIAPTQPTMLRVLAAGALLAHDEDARAIEVLREAAQQPNRQIALAAAGLIQKYLGVDMGLAVGGQLPAANTREAAEVTRRVLQWSSDPSTLSGSDLPEAISDSACDVAHF